MDGMGWLGNCSAMTRAESGAPMTPLSSIATPFIATKEDVSSKPRVIESSKSKLVPLPYATQPEPLPPCVHAIGSANPTIIAVTAKTLAQLPEGTPAVIVLGGETTVRVGDAGGRGGPCTELVLAGAIEIAGQSSVAIGAFATDGVDGPTDAAGAWATPTTCDAARLAGLDPAKSLIGHDSGSFFERVGGLIRTGPTGTNVNDVMVGLRY